MEKEELELGEIKELTRVYNLVVNQQRRHGMMPAYFFSKHPFVSPPFGALFLANI